MTGVQTCALPIFYYDFLDRYVDRRDFELIQMDTDSNYMAISGDKLEDIIHPAVAVLGQVEWAHVWAIQT